jgi:U3 small nucleolar RNA-associated protein 20
LNQRTLQSRLLSFLKAFATVKGSDQLYQRSILSSIFQVNLSHQDPIIASTSLTCLLNFRIPHIEGYADKLLNLLKQGALRESLLDWNVSIEGEVIDPSHRPALIPLLQRILFGRLSSSSVRGTKTKDSPQSRRKAIISCLSQLEGDELFPTFYLMIRNYIPKSFQIQPERMHVFEYREEMISLINHTKSLCLRDFPIQRHEGFLNLLSSVISQIGHGLSQYVPPFMSILVSIMNSPSSELDMVNRNDSEDKELMHGCTVGTAHRSRSLKTLAYRCAGVLMDKFASSIDFSLQMESLWNGISDAVLSLPDVVSKSNSCPLILQLLLVLSSHPCYICFLSLHQEVVKSVVMCIGPSTEDKALDKALEFVLNLLHLAETDNAASRDCYNLISNHVMLLLHRFQLRFCGISDEGSHERKFNKGAKTGSTFPKELQVLRLVSQAMKEGRINASDAEIEDSQTEVYNTLTSLLVGFISNLRIHSDELVNLMRIVSALLDKVDSVTAVSHFFSLSKILSFETWNRLPPLGRQEMLATMRTVSKCNTDYATLDLVTITLQDIFAMNSKRVDEVDYDRVLPILSCLQDPTSPRYWNSYLRQDALSDNRLKYLSPIIYSCLTLLQQNDLVLSRSANKALRSLIFTSCQETSHQGSHSSSAWSKLIESCVIPGARSALRNSNEQIKRHGLTLIADISKAYAGNESVNLHGDLHVLACEDNPDLDFFMNALHVQFHRRGRAMQRLRSKLNDIEKSNEFLSVTSITAVLLPLVTHPIYEYDSKLDEVLAQECIVTVGALVRQLSWSKYHAVLWTALNQVDRHPNQERLIIAMICSILDACHFDLLEKDTSENRETAVWRALEKRIIPKVEQLMTNEKKGSSRKSIKLLRPNIFLALVKLMKKFPSHYFEKRFPRLLAIICDALKNRESNVRELARKALAATVIEVGPLHLSEIFKSLALSLTEGYQLHVRSATLHQILYQLSKEMNQSSDVSSRLEFDKCIPAMMDFIFQDIFGAASDRRDSDGSRKQLVKEATGSKYLDSVEMICQLLTFRPSEKISLNLENCRSSIHDVVNPFFEKLKQESIPPKFVQKIKECLTRVVTGLSHNQSARFEEVLELSYATIYPLMEYSNAQARLFHDVKKISDNDHSVIVWQPSTLSGPQNIKDAQLNKITDQAKLITVLDGSQAPKLTGTSRLEQSEHGMWNSQAIGCATEFALNLLWTAVKGQSLPFCSDFISRLKPFLSLLTKCVDQSRETSVIAMSIRCLALILKKGVLPSREVLLPLSTKIIHILSEGEASVGTNEEMMQSCLSALVALIKAAGAKQHIPAQMKTEKLRKSVLSMSEEQMIVLVSFLRESLLACNDSNASIELVNLLVQQRFASPEFYDLMEQILDLSVRSHKESFRSVSAFVHFGLVETPLTSNLAMLQYFFSLPY